MYGQVSNKMCNHLTNQTHFQKNERYSANVGPQRNANGKQFRSHNALGITIGIFVHDITLQLYCFKVFNLCWKKHIEHK